MADKIIKDIKSRKNKWRSETERLILYADIMGFKNRVLSKNQKSLKQELLKYNKDLRDKIYSFADNNILKFVQFSDSILIVVNGVDDEMFELLTKCALCLMQTSLEHHFPIKGAIAQGQFSYMDKEQLYFGKPLVDAVALHDCIKYYGIVVHHSAEHLVKTKCNATNPYSNTQIPIEKGFTSHFHLCWNLVDNYFVSTDNTDLCEKWLDTISEQVSGEPRLYIDKTINVLHNDQKYFKDHYHGKYSEDVESK